MRLLTSTHFYPNNYVPALGVVREQAEYSEALDSRSF